MFISYLFINSEMYILFLLAYLLLLYYIIIANPFYSLSFIY